MLDFPPAQLLSATGSFGAEHKLMRPSSSQFDRVELIWMYFSAELNFSCWSISYQTYYPWLCSQIYSFIYLFIFTAVWWRRSFKYSFPFGSFFSPKRKKHNEAWRDCHSFSIELFRVMVSTIPSGSCTHICTKTHNTLVPPQTTHGGTLCSWVGWAIFVGGGGWPGAEATFSGAVLLSDLFWNLSDSRRLAHVEGVVVFGKCPLIFWQNHSQLWGRNVVCLPLRSCVSLMPWRFDGKEKGHECCASAGWLKLILFLEFRSWSLRARGRGWAEGVFFC